MKSCIGCRHADWKRTARGCLHPSGDGFCQFTVKMPVLSAAQYWLSTPRQGGGFISRREELHDHCPCFERGEYVPVSEEAKP